MQPTGDRQQQGGLEVRLTMACNTFAATTPNAHLEGMLACILNYRDFMQRNRREAGPISPDKFCSWLEAETNDPEEFPEPWGADLLDLFDNLMVEAVREDNAQPAEAIEAFARFAEKTEYQARQARDLPDEWFDGGEG